MSGIDDKVALVSGAASGTLYGAGIVPRSWQLPRGDVRVVGELPLTTGSEA